MEHKRVAKIKELQRVNRQRQDQNAPPQGERVSSLGSPRRKANNVNHSPIDLANNRKKGALPPPFQMPPGNMGSVDSKQRLPNAIIHKKTGFSPQKNYKYEENAAYQYQTEKQQQTQTSTSKSFVQQQLPPSSHGMPPKPSQSQFQQRENILHRGPRMQNQALNNSGSIDDRMNQPSKYQEEEFRMTWKQKPKISKQLPHAFNSIPMKNSKKTFAHHQQEMQVKNELQTKDVVEKLESAKEAEDFKHMKAMLKPLDAEQERREKVQRTLISQAQFQLPDPQQKKKQKSKDHFSKAMAGAVPNEPLGLGSKSNGFLLQSNKARENRALAQYGEIRLHELVTLNVIKGSSYSGTVKKMLHVPTMTIMSLKEVPIQSREVRAVLKEMIENWQRNNNKNTNMLKIYAHFWNQPEGCVSVLSNFCNAVSLKGLIDAVGRVPEQILQEIALKILHAIDQLHTFSNQAHLGLNASQVLFTTQGGVSVSFGFSSLLKLKDSSVKDKASLNLHQNEDQLQPSLLNFLPQQEGERINVQKTAKAFWSYYKDRYKPLNKDQQQFRNLQKLDIYDFGYSILLAACGDSIPASERIPCQMVKLKGKEPPCCCLLHCALSHSDSSKEVRAFRFNYKALDPQFTELVCKCICFKDKNRLGASEVLSDKKGWLFKTLKNLRTKMNIEELLKVSQNSNVDYIPSQATKFQNQQMERLCEAIALVPLRENQTIQLKNKKIKELAEDQGFDFEVLNDRLREIVRQNLNSREQNDSRMVEPRLQMEGPHHNSLMDLQIDQSPRMTQKGFAKF